MKIEASPANPVHRPARLTSQSRAAFGLRMRTYLPEGRIAQRAREGRTPLHAAGQKSGRRRGSRRIPRCVQL